MALEAFWATISASTMVESPGLPPPTLSPISISTTGASGARMAMATASAASGRSAWNSSRRSHALWAIQRAALRASSRSRSATARKLAPNSSTSE